MRRPFAMDGRSASADGRGKGRKALSVDKVSDLGFSPRAKVLLVEDDEQLAGAIIDALGKRQYEVLHICNGSEGLCKVGEGGFDILVIDRILPEVFGISIVQELRRQNFNVPVLIISGLDAVDERVLGLEAGADDYLIKPFSLEELGARVDALLRRPLQSCATKLQVGPLTLDLLRRTAYLGEEKIELSAREFQLLEYFMSNAGRLVTRQMLLRDVWKFHFLPQTNVVDQHISKLRHKIEGGRSCRFFVNVRGQGHIFDHHG
ncbi:response regulator transcription factor [Methylosinus sp. LW4]|uniref:response regulator transcription factor n=1 Tax=Methylosinus sp. LW4 TaxID=136993 RepID=UPI0003A6B7FB|nr:response regulator transcription factor [Methylosinus sp. LW4]